MKPGKAPQPVELKLIKGTASNHPTEKSAMAPPVEAPECPVHLTDAARAEWERIVPLLINLRILSKVDTAALALYCQSYGRWQFSEAEIKKMGGALMVKAPSGYPIQNPYLAIANRAMEDCHRYLQQFGLSPSARTRVTVTVQGDLFVEPETKAAGYFA